MFRRNALLLLAALIAVTAIYFPRTAQEPELPNEYHGRNNTVLFLSNGDSGLANVALATSHALISEHGDIEVHYGTFKKFEQRIQRLNKSAKKAVAGAGSIKFHEFSGLDFEDTLKKQGQGLDETVHRHGIEGFEKLRGNINKFMVPWTGPDYLDLYTQSVALIERVDPAVVVVESLFFPGVDAVRALGRREVILTPNSLKDAFADSQPWLSIFWKYPL